MIHARKFIKIPEFVWYLPEKLTKLPTFTRFVPEKNARILGGTCLTYPRLLRLWERAFLNFNFSAICQWLTSLSADDGLYVFRRLNQCESSGDGLAMARNGCGLQVYSRSRCVRQKCPIHTADATKLSSCVASAVWTQFATSSRRLPTDSVDNWKLAKQTPWLFDYVNFDKYW